MRHRKLLFRLCCVLLVLSLMPIGVVAANPPSQAGPRKLEGGQRDFLWPVPGYYNLSSCFLDNRNHYSLDISAPSGVKIVASYPGKVIDVFTGCEHNWGKKGSCCSSWGNYVLLEHPYILKDGTTITLYSRYAHLSTVSVSVGQKVAAGQKIGTNGSTGNSTGPHLDYDILYGGTSPSRTYSLDPYINELLELPEELYTSFGGCCQEYVAYVKKLYPRCTHAQYNSAGACTECGYVFDWKTTRDTDAKGYYTVAASTKAYTIPYTQAESKDLTTGQKLSVNSDLVNGLGQTWYEVAFEDGTIGYAPKAALTFHSYFASKIQLSDCTVSDGIQLMQESYRLDGKVTSLYPLRKVVGYLDGEEYASWTGTGGTTQLNLRSTNLNKKLNFAEITPGEHTLVIYVTDSTGRDAVKLYEGAFTIKKTLQNFTVTFGENSTITIQEGSTLGDLPVLSMDGQIFLGWFTETDEAVTAETLVTGDMTLHAKWEEIPVETEPTIPSQPEETPTQPSTIPETEPAPEQEASPEEAPGLWWLIPVILAAAGIAVGAVLWIQKKKSAQALS